jgi:hypothetical protein
MDGRFGLLDFVDILLIYTVVAFGLWVDKEWILPTKALIPLMHAIQLGITSFHNHYIRSYWMGLVLVLDVAAFSTQMLMYVGYMSTYGLDTITTNNTLETAKLGILFAFMGSTALRWIMNEDPVFNSPPGTYHSPGMGSMIPKQPAAMPRDLYYPDPRPMSRQLLPARRADPYAQLVARGAPWLPQ